MGDFAEHRGLIGSLAPDGMLAALETGESAGWAWGHPVTLQLAAWDWSVCQIRDWKFPLFFSAAKFHYHLAMAFY